MKKWLVLGLSGLAVAWGPYLYVQLTRTPAEASAKPARVSSDVSDALEIADGEEAGDPRDDDDQASAEDPAAAAAADDELAEEGPGAVLPDDPLAVQPGQPAPGGAAPTGAEDPSPQAADEHAAEPGASVEDTDEPEVPQLSAALMPAFHKAFDSEPRDAFWAADEEPRLLRLFQSAGVPADAMGEVSCRKTVCRVAFRAPDLENDVLAKLYESVLAEFGTGLALEDATAHDAEHAMLYLLRKGYSLDLAASP